MRNHDDTEMYADPLWHRVSNTTQSQNRVPYQATLRALGAYLDHEEARRINLLEENGGFAVRYQPDRDHPDSVMVHWENHALLSISHERQQKRRRQSMFGRAGQAKTTYENVLRALGYELDVVEAYSILVDEIDDGMVVTYQYLNPTEGFNAKKRMVILGSDVMKSVLQDAEARREQRKHGVLSLLAG